MQLDWNEIENAPLFTGIGSGDRAHMLQCLGASIREYPQNETIFFAGDPASRMGLLLKGSAQVERDDLFGNRTILTELGAGDLFGETFACAGVEALPVSVTASSSCRVLLLDFKKIIHTCPSACVFHQRLVENMLHILAEKNLVLNRKIEVLSARTTREKLLTYLTAQAQAAGSPCFEIPFNRQELADYLGVDRSAMSAALGKMRDEGVLRFYKNRFELLRPLG